MTSVIQRERPEKQERQQQLQIEHQIQQQLSELFGNPRTLKNQ